jgi:hypothetical protein
MTLPNAGEHVEESPSMTRGITKTLVSWVVCTNIYAVNPATMHGGPVESLKTEIREVGFFDAINATGSYEINVICQKSPRVSITALEHILPGVKTEVIDKTLWITEIKRIENEEITIDISMPTLARISSSGAHHVSMSDVDSTRLDMVCDGAGDYHITGKAQEFKTHISGVCHLNSRQLYAEKATIELFGAAMADVYAADELNAKIYGTGMISYYGSPKVVTKNVYGIGVIQSK